MTRGTKAAPRADMAAGPRAPRRVKRPAVPWTAAIPRDAGDRLEMHHRVRNLCQTVLSLIRVATRVEPGARGKDLAFVQGFVEALAGVHRLAFAPSDDDCVPVGDLLTEIVSLRRHALHLSREAVTVSGGELATNLTLDQAIAVAMWLTAAFPVPVGAAHIAPGAIAVSVRARGRRISIRVAEAGGVERPADPTTILLMDAYRAQLTKAKPQRGAAGEAKLVFQV